MVYAVVVAAVEEVDVRKEDVDSHVVEDEKLETGETVKEAKEVVLDL